MELIYSIDNKIELDWSSIYIYIVQENNPPIHIITTVHCTTYIFVNNRTHRRTCMQLTKFHFSIQHYYYYYYYFFSTMGSICRSLSFIVRMYIYIYICCPVRMMCPIRTYFQVEPLPSSVQALKPRHVGLETWKFKHRSSSVCGVWYYLLARDRQAGDSLFLSFLLSLV